DLLETDFILPESAIKPGLRSPLGMYSLFGAGKRFRGRVAVGIREFSIQLEVLPQALGQVRKLSEAITEGHYAQLLEVLGHSQEKWVGDSSEQSNDLDVIEGLLLADASGDIV